MWSILPCIYRYFNDFGAEILHGILKYPLEVINFVIPQNTFEVLLFLRVDEML